MDQSRLIDLAFDFCMRAEGNATYTDDPDDAGGPPNLVWPSTTTGMSCRTKMGMVTSMPPMCVS